jgi:hypothetical protein
MIQIMQQERSFLRRVCVLNLLLTRIVPVLHVLTFQFDLSSNQSTLLLFKGLMSVQRYSFFVEIASFTCI